MTARPRERRLAGVAVALVVLTLAGGKAAAGSAFPVVASVAIVAPGPPDAVVTEAVARLRAELSAVGLASHTVSCTDPAAADALACAAPGRLTGALPEKTEAVVARTAATIVVAREDGVITLEVIERLSNGSQVFRLVYVPAAEGGSDPAVLAIRGVELLRDVHLDVERTGAGAIVPARVVMPVKPAPRPVALATAPAATQLPDPEDTASDADRPVVVAASPAPEVPAADAALTVHASLGVLQGRARLGPSLGPALGATFRLQAHWAAWATLAGPFYEDLRQDAATAATRQEFAMVGARFDFGARRARPFVTAGAGLYHLGVSGHSSAVAEPGLSSALWAPLIVAGAGCSYPLTRFIEIAAEGQAFLTNPAGMITVRDVEVGRAGAPSLLAQAELRVRFR